MKIRELQGLLNGKPSVSGSTFLVGSLYVAGVVFAVAFLVLGIGLLMESFFHLKIFLDWLSRNLGIALNDDQRWKIATSFGLISLILSVIFGGVIVLCRMVLVRNHFIINIEDWLYNNISEIDKPAAKSRRKT